MDFRKSPDFPISHWRREIFMGKRESDPVTTLGGVSGKTIQYASDTFFAKFINPSHNQFQQFHKITNLLLDMNLTIPSIILRYGNLDFW